MKCVKRVRRRPSLKGVIQSGRVALSYRVLAVLGFLIYFVTSFAIGTRYGGSLRMAGQSWQRPVQQWCLLNQRRKYRCLLRLKLFLQIISSITSKHRWCEACNECKSQVLPWCAVTASGAITGKVCQSV